MPSTSKKQHNLMAAVAHNAAFAKKVGIPQKVGKDFSEADKGRKFGRGGVASIGKQNTRHGKYDLPFKALNRYAGMAKGGDVKKELKAAGIFAKAGEKKLAAHERREAAGKEKDTPAIAKREMSVLKRAKAPKDVMDYESAEHEEMGMKKGGGVKKYARGGGIESRGKTKGTVVKMARGGSVGSASKRADGVASKGKTKGRFV